MTDITNPIPARARGWLYVVGIVVGGLVAIVVPDLLHALAVDQVWVDFAVRACGALTAVLAMLARANLTPTAGTTERANPELTDETAGEGE